jgi:hypothetical protein
MPGAGFQWHWRSPPTGVDLAAGVRTIDNLKSAAPVSIAPSQCPPALLDALDLVHGIRGLQAARGTGRGVRLWPWSRMTG